MPALIMTADVPSPHTPGRPRVLLAEASPDALGWLQEELVRAFAVERMDTGQAALDALGAGRAQAVVIGHSLDDMLPQDLLTELRDPKPSRSHGPSGAGSAGDSQDPGPDEPEDPEAQADQARIARLASVPVFLVAPADQHQDDARVYYVLDHDLDADDLSAVVASACGRDQAGGSDSDDDSLDQARRLQRVLEVSRQLAGERELEGAAEIVIRAVLTMLDADRAHCLFYDHDSGSLWSETSDHNFDGTASQGLAGFAARTGKAVHAPRADSDPRYRRGIDDPAGSGGERIAAQPILGSDGAVHAVLVAIRGGEHADFDAQERAEFTLLAEHAAPLLDLLARHLESKAALEAAAPESIFRREALDAYDSWQQAGDVIRISPRWLGRVYWLVLISCISVLVYSALGTVYEYSSGPAVVRVTGRTDITATIAGTIGEIQVVPGQRVAAGEVLVRLHDADALAALDRAQTEFEGQLRNLLRSPGDDGVRSSVAALRSQRDRAAAELEERLIRAPHDGTASDVRIRPGQALSPGELVMSLNKDDAGLTVIALLPGGDRPLIGPGMPLRLEIVGYRYAYQDLTVSAVTDEVIGPAEASRYLGPRIADSVLLDGSVVLIRARLPTPTFEVDGVEYRYHDGMQGIAEVRVRARTILENLIPALEQL